MGKREPQREGLEADLRGLVSGEVHCDPVHLQLYTSDGSIHEVRPAAVVRPRLTKEVVACVKYAAEKRIPIHARGAGSGLAGESLGAGIVLDFSRHFRHIRRLGDDTVHVQSGVVLQQLNALLRPKGRLFGPNPGNAAVTTVGSMIALDGAGRHWLKFGSVRRHIESLRVVMADGALWQIGREPLVDGRSVDPVPEKRELIDRLAALLNAHADRIAAHAARPVLPGGGYRVAGTLGPDSLDLAGLIAGSEGTLAVVTDAVLRTQLLPKCRAVTIFLFESLEAASASVPEVLGAKPSACDLLDRRHVSLAREMEPRFESLIPQETEAVLLVEMDGDRPAPLRDRVQKLVDRLCVHRQAAFAARHAFDAAEVTLFWQLARRLQPTVYRTKSHARPIPIVEDVSVDPACLPEFLVRVQNVLKRHAITASTSCHAGQGQVHIQPLLNLESPDDVQKMQRLAEDLYEETAACGGAIGGEHGCGLSRSPFLHRQVGELYDLFVQIKRLFDPQGLLNPGKVVGDNTALVTRHLAAPIPPQPAEPEPSETPKDGDRPPLKKLIELQLDWAPEQVSEVVRACNRCGECRTQTPEGRMCPMFRIMPGEEASPRAKVNLIRGVLTGQIPLQTLGTHEAKAVADLCFHCRMCSLECPAHVDVSHLSMHAKEAFVSAVGLPMNDWVLARVDRWAAWASHFSLLVNWALGNRQMRWLMEKTLGIAKGRKLPRISSRPFLRRAAHRRLTRPSKRPGDKVVYFVDTFANYFDPALGRALTAVMEHNGISVYVPPDQKPAGTPALTSGWLDLARRLAHHNVTRLAEAVRQGYHIVTSEPAAALALVQEYPLLLDESDDAKVVAENTSEACTYLWRLHQRGRLQLDLNPVSFSVGYHLPCRLKALEVGAPGESLLRLIPGMTVHRLEEGCSGMGGTLGLKRETFRASLRMGLRLSHRLRDNHIQIGSAECSACRLQMEQGANKPAIHPLKLLAHAYSLMPEVARIVTSPMKELVVL